MRFLAFEGLDGAGKITSNSRTKARAGEAWASRGDHSRTGGSALGDAFCQLALGG